MEREACVCDHGFERSDLCAEIIIIIIIIIQLTTCRIGNLTRLILTLLAICLIIRTYIQSVLNSIVQDDERKVRRLRYSCKIINRWRNVSQYKWSSSKMSAWKLF